MDRETAFAIWAPNDSPWTRWTKPVLFAHFDVVLPNPPIEGEFGDVSWAPPPAEGVAVVLDLPGAAGVAAGVALAARGYRPVPLYNAVPMPMAPALSEASPGSPVAAVDVRPIISALQGGAERLAALKVPVNAPPAFLLDAHRGGTGREIQPDQFDNRSICFTTDFPSATYLGAQGLHRVVLVQTTGLQPQADLAHTLRRWQEAGLILERVRLDSPGPPERFEVLRPSWYGAIFQRALAAFGLRRAGVSGFGAWVQNAAAGG